MGIDLRARARLKTLHASLERGGEPDPSSHGIRKIDVPGHAHAPRHLEDSPSALRRPTLAALCPATDPAGLSKFGHYVMTIEFSLVRLPVLNIKIKGSRHVRVNALNFTILICAQRGQTVYAVSGLISNLC
jgi:hypothetical protein